MAGSETSLKVLHHSVLHPLALEELRLRFDLITVAFTESLNQADLCVQTII